MNSKTFSTALRGITPFSSIPSHVLSKNLEQPSCHIDTPLVVHSSLGRMALYFANAGMVLSVLIELVMIALYKEVIVYENSPFILGIEILICLVMFILNIKEGLKDG